MINEINLGKIFDLSNLFLTESDEIIQLKNIYFALTEYQNIESEYVVTIKRILSFLMDNNKSPETFLNSLILKIKDFFKKKLEQHNEIYISLHNEICPSFGNILSNETLNFDNIKNDLITVNDEFKINKGKLDNAKSDYNKFGVEYLNNLSEKIKELINQKKLKISDKKFVEKLNAFHEKKNLKNSSQETTRNYINAINNYNSSIEKLISSTNEAYNHFKNIRENYMNNFTSLIKKLIEKEKFKNDSILDSLNELNSLLNSIQIKTELDDFIQKHILYIEKPTREDFTSFTSISPQFFDYNSFKKEFNEGNQLITLIKNNLSQEFQYFSPNLEHEREDIKKKFTDLQEYIIRAYEGKIGNDIEKLKNYFIEENKNQYILFFLSYLNRIRNKIINLSNNGYETIKDIFNLILDIIYEEKNYELIEFIIILSQTFYKTEKGYPRILLQDDIKGHKIFKEKETWIINMCIRLNKDLKKIDPNNKKQKNQIIFSALLTFKFNLSNFDFNNEEINDILRKIFEKYDIKEEGNMLLELNTLDSQLENNEEKKEEKKEEKEIK
jgi:hypothetical protein